jgi:hypothetical protein
MHVMYPRKGVVETESRIARTSFGAGRRGMVGWSGRGDRLRTRLDGQEGAIGMVTITSMCTSVDAFRQLNRMMDRISTSLAGWKRERLREWRWRWSGRVSVEAARAELVADSVQRRLCSTSQTDICGWDTEREVYRSQAANHDRTHHNDRFASKSRSFAHCTSSIWYIVHSPNCPVKPQNHPKQPSTSP